MSTQRIHSEGNCYLLGKKNGIEKCYCHSGFYFLFYVVWGSLKNKSWKLFRFFTGDMNWPVKMSLLKFSAQVTWGVTNRCKQQCCLRAESALVWLDSGVVFFPVICFIGRSWAWISRWQVNCSSHSCSSSPSRVLKAVTRRGPVWRRRSELATVLDKAKDCLCWVSLRLTACFPCAPSSQHCEHQLCCRLKPKKIR